MKAQPTIVIMAAAGAVLALCPSAYFNVAPNIERAAEGALSGQGYQEQLNRTKRIVRRLPYP